MKYLIALIAGFITGALLFSAAVFYNPFGDRESVSPLAVSNQQLLNLTFSAVPSEAVVFTNDGESDSRPHPEETAELWEDTIRNSNVLVVPLKDSRGEPAGIGVKFSSASEETRILNSEVLVDSAWHIYLPERGSLFVGQRENYWSYFRDIVAKAKWNSADSWRGAWNRVTTVGPNPIGTGRVSGGHGGFAGVDTEAVESLNASAYSAVTGPVSMDGSIAIAMPSQPDSQAAQQN